MNEISRTDPTERSDYKKFKVRLDTPITGPFNSEIGTYSHLMAIPLKPFILDVSEGIIEVPEGMDLFGGCPLARKICRTRKYLGLS